MSNENKFKISKRNSIFSELSEDDWSSEKDSYMEVTEWTNGEGYDVYINNYAERSISIGHNEFKLLKKLIKELDK
jgi:hypothetical protein